MDENKIIQDNTGLIFKAMKNISFPTYFEKEELVQIGRIAIWKSLKTFDDSKSKFSTYCYSSIRNDIIRFINDNIIDYANEEELENIEVNLESDIDLLILVEDIKSILTNLEFKIFYERCVYKYSIEEIAQINKTKYRNVKTILLRAKRKIKDKLNWRKYL